MVFSKEKMIQRIEQEGLMDLLDNESRELMDKIDGLPAEINRFKALVFDIEEYMVKHPETKEWIPVNKRDCV